MLVIRKSTAKKPTAENLDDAEITSYRLLDPLENRGPRESAVAANVMARRRADRRSIVSTDSKEELVEYIMQALPATGFHTAQQILQAAGKVKRIRFNATTLIDRRAELMKCDRQQLIDLYWGLSERRLNDRYGREQDYTAGSALRDWENPSKKDDDDNGPTLQEKIATAKAKAKARKKAKRRNPNKHRLFTASTTDWLKSLRQTHEYMDEGLQQREQWMSEIEERTKTKQKRSNLQ